MIPLTHISMKILVIVILIYTKCVDFLVLNVIMLTPSLHAISTHYQVVYMLFPVMEPLPRTLWVTCAHESSPKCFHLLSEGYCCNIVRYCADIIFIFCSLCVCVCVCGLMWVYSEGTLLVYVR